MTDCTIKKQKVSNVAEKNNTESVSTRKKISKRCSFSAINDESENWCPLLKTLTREIVNYLYQIVHLTEMRIAILYLQRQLLLVWMKS